MFNWNRVLIFTLLMVSFCLPVSAATDAEVVSSFKQYASDQLAKILETYEGVHYKVAYIEPDRYSSKPKGYWFKLTGMVDPNYKIDVQKTNSLVSPYVATLEVNYKTLFYYDRPTKETAEAVTDIKRVSIEVYKFTVAYQDEKWVVTEAKSYSSVLGKWFNRDTKDIYTELKCAYEKH